MPTAISAGGAGIAPDSLRIAPSSCGNIPSNKLKRIANLVQAGLQRRYCRFGPVKNGQRLLHIQFGNLAIAILYVRNLVAYVPAR